MSGILTITITAAPHLFLLYGNRAAGGRLPLDEGTNRITKPFAYFCIVSAKNISKLQAE